MAPPRDLSSGFRALVLLLISYFSTRAVIGAPATTGAVVQQIGDGQIQVPGSPPSASSFFRAIDVAGHDIVYIVSVGLNSLGNSTTW